MNVMYAADNGYAEIAAVSMESLLDMNRSFNKITIFFVEDAITDENKCRLVRTAEKYGREIIFLPKPDIRMICDTELRTLRWSDSAYSRLFLDILFCNYPEVHKLLYLDCDTLVVNGIQELWEEDVNGYLGAAVWECMSNMHKRIIGAKPSDNYINTGMILFNVDRWKSEKISTTCTEFIKKYKGKTEYVDQGVINGTVSNRMKIINPRYNLTALSWDFSYDEMRQYRKPEFAYEKNVWEEAINNPAIIHFTTSFLSTRPWFEGDDTPWTQKWREYKAQSEWKDEPLKIMKDKGNHEMKIKVFNRIPRRIGISMAGFLHAYLKPMAYALKAWI